MGTTDPAYCFQNTEESLKHLEMFMLIVERGCHLPSSWPDGPDYRQRNEGEELGFCWMITKFLATLSYLFISGNKLIRWAFEPPEVMADCHYMPWIRLPNPDPQSEEAPALI